MASSGIGNLTFSGSSTYSSDFQTVLNRAVAIASQPMFALQNDVSVLQSKQSALASLDSTFIALQAAIGGVSAAAPGTPTASSSNSPAVKATAASNALTGSYTVQVDSLGAATTTLSKSSLTAVSDPSSTNISTSTQWTLTVNGTAHSITSAGTSLTDLVTAINGSGDGVQATIVNVGPSATPDYRLVVTSNNLAADSIQLNDGTQDVLDPLSTGTPALYKVNGQATDIASSSTQVTLSPGLTIQLLQTTTSPATITVTKGSTALQSALSSLVSAYNTAVDAIGHQRGQSGGALSGESVIYSLSNTLSQIVNYTTGSGSVHSLADVGVVLDDTGHLSFSNSVFNAADLSSIQSYLGSVSSSGLLKTANDALNVFTDSTKGFLQGESNGLQDRIKADNSHIADDQARILNLQKSLQAQLAAADALIATLQAQSNYFLQLFTATYGNSNGSNNNNR